MGESATKTQIIVAIIGLAGVLGAALLANWDKIFGPVVPSSQTAPPLAPIKAKPQANGGSGSEGSRTDTLVSAPIGLIVVDGLWESINSGNVRQIIMAKNGLREQIENSGNWHDFDRVSLNVYRRKKSDDEYITLNVVDENTIQEKIGSNRPVHVWVRTQRD